MRADRSARVTPLRARGIMGFNREPYVGLIN